VNLYIIDHLLPWSLTAHQDWPIFVEQLEYLQSMNQLRINLFTTVALDQTVTISVGVSPKRTKASWSGEYLMVNKGVG
jgi:hypothetical protein